MRMCKRNPGLRKVLEVASQQAITACEETFKYDRWNCSLVYNKKPKRNIFKKIYRETAFVHALIAASITHAVARACSSGELSRCACLSTRTSDTFENVSWQWKGGCGDDFNFGKRYTKNFLEFKSVGNDQVADILKQDVMVGINSVGEQLKEVCKCHGFSGSCTTKTCWKRLGPFNSAMGLLKKQYHHALKKKLVVKRAITPNIRKKVKDRKNLVYLQKTPNLCLSTKSRVCKDVPNCATLCCGRGYSVGNRSVTTRCRCRMVDCCFVKCDTCLEVKDYYVCK
ncbi:protein Wnt-4 [Aricia agestis]|uniref:protein Wnt-4 n=1 Tax=Aricia agestis TaxID=91739 RepID=UPI001C20A224|nr:protein Wnt-4 [Aricia agestis]